MPETNITAGTKKYFMALAYLAGETWISAYHRFSALVRAQTSPWIYTENTSNGRVPKDIPLQLIDLKRDVRRKWNEFERGGLRPDEIPATGETPDATPEIPDETPAIPETPRASGKSRIEREVAFFLREWERISDWIDTRASNGHSRIDNLRTMRIPLEGSRAIIEGISAKAMLYSMTLSWSDDSRAQAGIETVDFHDEIEVIPGTDSKGNPYHRLTGYVLRLLRANVPVLLTGGAGVGKSHLCRQVAEILNLDFGYIGMTGGASPSWLLGRNKLSDEYMPSRFVDLYEKGGVFLIDEIDAADSNMMLALNNALASDQFDNPISGRMIPRGKDFHCIASANTNLLGADDEFVGRDRQDAAVRDRFRMGRVPMQLDRELVTQLVNAQVARA